MLFKILATLFGAALGAAFGNITWLALSTTWGRPIAWAQLLIVAAVMFFAVRACDLIEPSSSRSYAF